MLPQTGLLTDHVAPSSGGSSRELCIIIDKETVELTGQLGDLYNKYDMTAVDLPADGTGQLTVLRPPP